MLKRAPYRVDPETNLICHHIHTYHTYMHTYIHCLCTFKQFYGNVISQTPDNSTMSVH